MIALASWADAPGLVCLVVLGGWMWWEGRRACRRGECVDTDSLIREVIEAHHGGTNP